MNFVIQTLAAIGFAISQYVFWVEKRTREDRDYTPLCDINDRISCTRAFKSRYGNLLGFSNSILGMFFYTVLFIAQLLGFEMMVFGLSFAAAVASFGLAYILYFRVKSLCLICTSIYVINILLLVFSYSNL